MLIMTARRRRRSRYDPCTSETYRTTQMEVGSELMSSELTRWHGARHDRAGSRVRGGLVWKRSDGSVGAQVNRVR